MRDNKFLKNAVLVLLIGLVLGFLSVYASRYATSDDLGQLAFMLVIFFPVSAAVMGIISSISLKKIGATAVLTGLAFVIVMIAAFKSVNYVYILVYILVSLIAYMLTNVIASMARRRPK